MELYDLAPESIVYQRIVGPCNFKPGSFWKIEGKPDWEGGWCPDYLQKEGIYVRDEKVNYGTWHVFASLDVNGITSRVRIPTGDISLREGTVRYEGDLIERVIISKKGDLFRTKGMDKFIILAKELLEETDDERVKEIKEKYLRLSA